MWLHGIAFAALDTIYGAGVWDPGSVTLSHSCEDVSEGGPLVGLVSPTSSIPKSCAEEELTSRFTKSITILR
jgi:hypothetical protein